MDEPAESILYIATVGAEDPDKASFPFVLAVAALAMDIDATIVLQSNAVAFAQRGFVDTVPPAGGLPPLKSLLSDFLELGGKILVCGPCIKTRGIEVSDLVDGAEVAAAARVNLAALQARAVFVY
ncbi:MAG: DsrE family protein [Deltaproteobacteria bacterium]|nr:DsrE family protein [Deltaproteobacteria bacterium]